MKPNVIFLLLLFFSCKDANNNAGANNTQPKSASTTGIANESYKIDADGLLKDFMSWYNYTYYNVRLVQDFIAEDVHSNQISKRAFLQALTSGRLVAFKTAKRNNVPVYQLFEAGSLQPDIKDSMVQMAQTALALANMEGKELPPYSFTDLNGKLYNNNNTRGYVILLKCWFIHCVNCVKEFPELNHLVDRYKDRKDIKFISLASDSRTELLTFLKKKPFKYAVVPEMDNYMSRKLNVNAYPLHLLINRRGTIVKVTKSMSDMLPYFEKELGSSNLSVTLSN